MAVSSESGWSVVPGRSPPIGAVDLVYPFTGSWLTQNSPADRVPSHGTRLFAGSYAIDFVPVDDGGRSAAFTLRSLLQPEPPERFTGFGRAVHAPIAGVVVGTSDDARDHAAYRGLPSLGYALGQRRRVRAGWPALAGNHVLIEASDVVIALCHLQQGSVRVGVGDHVRPGDVIGRCGNTGNSTEPHLHLQAMDARDPAAALAVPITLHGTLPRNGQIVAAG